MEGLAIGTSRFSTALLAALGIGGAFLCLRFLSFGIRHRYDAVVSLRVSGDALARLATLKDILERHATRLDLATAQRTTKEGTEVSYRLLLRDTARAPELESELTTTEGFENVCMHLHDDEAEI